MPGLNGYRNSLVRPFSIVVHFNKIVNFIRHMIKVNYLCQHCHILSFYVLRFVNQPLGQLRTDKSIFVKKLLRHKIVVLDVDAGNQIEIKHFLSCFLQQKAAQSFVPKVFSGLQHFRHPVTEIETNCFTFQNHVLGFTSILPSRQ